MDYIKGNPNKSFLVRALVRPEEMMPQRNSESLLIQTLRTNHLEMMDELKSMTGEVRSLPHVAHRGGG